MFDDLFRRLMESVEKCVDDFISELMDSERVAGFNSDLQHRNQIVIRWLINHGAPAELIEEAKELEAQGNAAIMAVIDEIRLCGGKLCVVPEELLRLLLEAAGPRATAVFLQTYRDYFKNLLENWGNNHRE